MGTQREQRRTGRHFAFTLCFVACACSGVSALVFPLLFCLSVPHTQASVPRPRLPTPLPAATGVQALWRCCSAHRASRNNGEPGARRRSVPRKRRCGSYVLRAHCGASSSLLCGTCHAGGGEVAAAGGGCLAPLSPPPHPPGGGGGSRGPCPSAPATPHAPGAAPRAAAAASARRPACRGRGHQAPPRVPWPRPAQRRDQPAPPARPAPRPACARGQPGAATIPRPRPAQSRCQPAPASSSTLRPAGRRGQPGAATSPRPRPARRRCAPTPAASPTSLAGPRTASRPPRRPGLFRDCYRPATIPLRDKTPLRIDVASPSAH